MKPYHRLSRHYGNETLFEMVEMSIISSLWGDPLHIHAEGLRGTGKTTIMRSAKNILPDIERIKGCLYNCDPNKPHCPNHAHLSPEEIKTIGSEMVPMPFLEISHSAKIGTVAGSIDLARITDPSNPTAAILPGVIPQAHRGIVFVDEINRLADTSPEITDVLLDVMGTKPGRIQIEEAGIPLVQIPVQVSVWAASNPDEEPGPLEEIRKQLSDRFDLVIYMGRPNTLESITDILLQSELSRLGEGGFGEVSTEGDRTLKAQFAKLSSDYYGVTMPDFLRSFIARIYLKYHIESLRAIEGIQQSAVLSAVLRKRRQVLVSDVIKVLPLALKHRVEVDTLTKILNSLDRGEDLGAPAAPSAREAAEKGAKGGGIKSIFGGGKEKAEEANPGVDTGSLLKARKLGEMGRDELIRTEKDLKPPER
ncbi:MAG: magnesium chelatase [Firmicutes bacterium]|nr:magnesium chelatase [Bacillota bacterium]